MNTRQILPAIVAAAAAALVSACSPSTPTTGPASGDDSRPVVVASSAIAADFVNRIAGDAVQVVTLVPNSIDTHTYEPAPSELRELERADLVVLPDADLNPTVTQVVGIAVDKNLVLDLNAASLTADDYVYRDSAAQEGRNVHTWTDPALALKWVAPLADRLAQLAPQDATAIAERAQTLTAELEELDTAISERVSQLPEDARKLVVYHDAWEYFGKRYNFTVVGALQAVDFAEPSAAELAAMSDQIRSEGVPAFFGSEVFPSDVMEALQAESGARYVPDLADDALPGEPGTPEHSYLVMMGNNVDLIVTNLAPAQ